MEEGGRVSGIIPFFGELNNHVYENVVYTCIHVPVSKFKLSS